MSQLNQSWVNKLRAAGLTVKGVPGWEKRGHRGRVDFQGVLNHHTGADNDSRAYAEWMAKDGRDDLPAPIANVAMDQLGVVYVLAAGLAWHAGDGNGTDPTTEGRSANPVLVGLEMMYDGTKPPAAMVTACVLFNAVTLEHLGQPTSHALGHRETSTTGKWDPGAISMNGLRRRIAARRQLLRRPTKPSDNGTGVYEVKSGVEAWARTRPSTGSASRRAKRLKAGERYRLGRARKDARGRVWRETKSGNWINVNVVRKVK